MLTISPISFPGLGINIDPPASFALGALTVNFYGICIATGLLLAVLYGSLRAKQFGFRQDDILDGVLWVVPFAILCARLYYCIFYWNEGGYAANPLSILYVWEGGLAIYGGVIGAIVGIIVFCKVKKISIGAVLDIVALGFLIGQTMGRWGNFFNREAFGAETDSFLRMGLYNAYAEIWEYHHPTFLYESIWDLAGFLFLHWYSKRRKFRGEIALMYAGWYGMIRFLTEFLRTDSLFIGNTGIKTSQLIGDACVVISVGLLIYFYTTKKYPKPFGEQTKTESETEE